MAIGAILAAAGSVISVGASTVSFVDPLKRMLGYAFNTALPNLEIDPTLALLAYRKRHLSDAEYTTTMKKYGYSEEKSNLLLEMSWERLPLAHYVTLYRRKKITLEELAEKAWELNVRGEELGDYLKATEYFPPPDDLVRFAVRDVYSPNTIKEFRLFEDMPDKFTEEAEKSGLTRDMAQLYWGSHWQLPSINMGYEMLHRNIINPEQLKLLMKALDIAPGWRDNLIKLSYNPLTRVDVRRMWDTGVITDYNDLVQQYKNAGYDADNSKRLADFTIKLTQNEMEGITRANIGDAYMLGVISENIMYDYLLKLEKSETFAVFWKEYYQLKRTQKEVKEREDELIEMFSNGGLDYEELRQQLVNDGASLDYINYVLRKVQNKQRANIKQPDRDTLLRWYEKGIIPDSEFYRYMRLLGYTDKSITYYLTELNEPEKPRERKFLSIDKYMSFFLQDFMTLEDLIYVLSDMGLVFDDIMRLLLEHKDKIAEMGIEL